MELRDRALLEVLYATGMRVSEVAALTVAQVRDREHLRTRGKGNRDRIVVLGTPAQRALEAIFDAPGAEVVLEERLEGDEISVLLFVSDDGYRLMPPSRDYKRVGDGDVGPMTGGMGTVAPLPLTPAELDDLERSVVDPVMAGLRAEGIDYRGVLYIGVMRTPDGYRVLEFNVRFGDPETQVLMPLLASDAGTLFTAVATGRLADSDTSWSAGHAACVVMAAPGYPGKATAGVPIHLPAALPDGVRLFHSGTAGDPPVSAGGRVLNVVAVSDALDEAVRLAYRTVDTIGFAGAVVRRDIGSFAGAVARRDTGGGIGD